MSDYSWIKPNVLAVITNPYGRPDPEGFEGQVVEITSTPFFLETKHGCTISHPILERVRCDHLKPYKPKGTPDWNEIAKEKAKPCVDFTPVREVV